MPNRSLILAAAAFVSLVLSIFLWFTGDKQAGLFVGLWVPSILSTGVYVQAPRMRFDAVFGLAVVTSFLLSIGLWFSGSKDAGVFVGLWVPSILAAGVFFMNTLRAIAAQEPVTVGGAHE